MVERISKRKQNFFQGDLILVNFNFTDLKDVKLRPAIIVSNDKFNEYHQDIILVPLTSVIRDEEISLIINSDDLMSGNLVKTSVVRIDKISSINKILIKANIGKLQESLLKNLLNKIYKILEK